MKEISPFECSSHPYYILTQKYVQGSFGQRSYYHLCHILNEMGYEAYITDDCSIPDLHKVTNLRTPLLTPQVRQLHRLRGCRPIAVYGEEIDENILGGDIVTWWIMNIKGHVREVRNFDKDIVFYCGPSYVKGIENPEFLRMIFIDRRIFNKESAVDGERNGFCWYAHKYLEYQDRPIPEFVRKNGTSVCRNVNLGRKELADIFRKSKVLYLYEDSAIGTEARLCGCPVAFIKGPYFDNFDTSAMNHSLFIDEKDTESGYIPDFDFEKFIKEYEDVEKNSWETIWQFVDTTQKAAAECCSDERRHSNLIEFCNEHAPLYIYGKWHWGKQCLDVLRTYGIKVEAFVVGDDKYAENKGEVFGLPVLPLSVIENEKHKCGIIIAISIKIRDEAASALKRGNFLHYKHYPVLV